MQHPRYYDSASGPVLGFEADMKEIVEWHPTIAQLRDTVLAGMIVGSHLIAERLPPEVAAYAPSQAMVERIADACLAAVSAGRLIDFGAWTQEVICHGGNRGGPLYSKGAIGHPFSRPWMFVHTWEGETSVYMVNPLEPERLAGGDCEALELNPTLASGHRALMIGDQVILRPGEAEGADWRKYHCVALPSVWRFMPGAEAINRAPPANAAAGNVLDPLMTALLIINTRGVERTTVAVSDKLQKARAKNGKPPIPSYERVDSRLYVTAIEARRARGRSEPKGGHHASPIGHLRMGHPRTYASGVVRFIPDTLVNMSDDAKAAFRNNRSHYEVRS